jgi:hypothetical protein
MSNYPYHFISNNNLTELGTSLNPLINIIPNNSVTNFGTGCDLAADNKNE